MSFLGGHWYPCFGFLVMFPLGFKATVELSYFFCGSECNVHSPRSTSGATHANLLAAHFPICISRGGTQPGFEPAISRTEDERTTIVPATRLSVLVQFRKNCIWLRLTYDQDDTQKECVSKISCSLPDALVTLRVEEMIPPDEVRSFRNEGHNPNLE